MMDFTPPNKKNWHSVTESRLSDNNLGNSQTNGTSDSGCVYASLGNGIVKRRHRTVKRITARKQCTVMVATYIDTSHQKIMYYPQLHPLI